MLGDGEAEHAVRAAAAGPRGPAVHDLAVHIYVEAHYHTGAHAQQDHQHQQHIEGGASSRLHICEAPITFTTVALR